MSPLLLMPLALLASFACGWWSCRWMARRRPAEGVSLPLTPATPATAAPPAAAPPAATTAAPPPAPAPGHASLELHLVLNVMNRVVMAMHQDEHLQDGVTYIADYLRAVHELQRHPTQNALVQQLSTYWRLSRWLHGQPGDALHVDAQLPGMPPALLARCSGELVRAIRDLETCARADAAIRVVPPAPGGPADGVLIQVTVAGLAPAAQAQLSASGRAWSASGSSLLLQLTLHP